MRKFTKEIATLLAAVSVSASANMAIANAEKTNAAAAQNETSFTTTAGVRVTTHEGTEAVTTATTTEVILPPDEGVAMPPDEYTTTSTATTTTTIGTSTSKLTTTTTTVPANDSIELSLEEVEMGEDIFTDDGICGEYAAFHTRYAEYVTIDYSVIKDCDEIEVVLITDVDGELVKERFHVPVENGIAKITYHVPANSDDYFTAVVFDAKEKGIALEKVRLEKFDREIPFATTSIPPLMGTIVATTETTTFPPEEGVAMPPDEYTTATTIPPLAGEPLPPDEYITTTVPPLAGVPLPPDEYTTTTTIPPLMGTQTIPTSTTTQTYIAGGMMPPDEGTTTTTTIPPIEGTQMPTTEPETFPPLMGVMPIHIYGDANNDSTVSIADAAAILQYIANPDKYQLSENGMIAADVVGNGNGITVDDAIAIQKLDAKIIDDFSELD